MDPWWWWTVSWASHFGARSCGTANINGLAAPLANASHLFKRSDERSESETLILGATSCPNFFFARLPSSADYIYTYVCYSHWADVDFRIARVIHSDIFLVLDVDHRPRNVTTFKWYTMLVINYGFESLFLFFIFKRVNREMDKYENVYIFIQRSDDIIDDVFNDKKYSLSLRVYPHRFSF